MEEYNIISKNRLLSPAEDYELLRKTGLDYIEQLGSDLWTDYNAHDPGVTILETISYAITELTYRTNIDMKDLLTESNEKIGDKQAFFTARNILTCSALNINDYRKLLVDITGVHNAWLYATDRDTFTNGNEVAINEVPLFADCKKDILSTIATPHPIFISGLYKVLLDLDNDDQFGDLNKGDIEIVNPASAAVVPTFKAGEISFTIELPFVHEVATELINALADTAHITSVIITLENARWKCTVANDIGLPDFNFIITINLKPRGREIVTADMQDFFTPKFVSQIFYQYQQKIQKVKSILLQVKKTLHENRNLGEDFIKTAIVKDEEVAICCDIDVKPDADMEAVQAMAFYLIENYLNPNINFYLLKELLAKGITADEIFEGPMLNHGFIDTVELEATQLRSVIHVSDIISLIMDVPGVLAVRNFMLTKYDHLGNAVAGQVGLLWCINIGAAHKPVLSVNRSKIIFYKNNFPFLAAYTEIKDSLQLMRATRERPKLKGQQDDLAMPTGVYRKLDEYWSVQNDLPQTYGVGQAGLPLTATPQRKGYAKQLKAYLMFYDQLLADFFSQLQNAKKLFGLDNIRQTYFSQFLSSIPGILPVYKNDGSGHPLIGTVFQTPDSTLASPNSQWKALVENDTVFGDRRNRFLDQLLARFGESFNEYVLMMYSISQKDSTGKAISSEKLISNKIDFLKAYPELSYGRGKAFNCYPLTAAGMPDGSRLWDTTNVSGLEKRSGSLAGIIDSTRRFLSCIKNIEVKTIRQKVVQEDSTELVKTFYEFTLQNKRGDQLVPKDKYEDKAQLEKVIAVLAGLLADKANYLYDNASNKIEVIGDDSNVLVTSLATYTEKADADKVIKQFETEFKHNCPDGAGMLLIEHLLLRPREVEDQLMQVCLDKDCEFCGEEDPYTYRASVFLPYQAEQFSSMNFRTYFENMIRTEVPAHLMLKVCWINNEQMRQLEILYKRWLVLHAAYIHNASDVVNSTAFQTTNNELIILMTTLHTVYPAATLHDCDESINTNPVMLGKTILGTIKPKNNE